MSERSEHELKTAATRDRPGRGGAAVLAFVLVVAGLMAVAAGRDLEADEARLLRSASLESLPDTTGPIGRLQRAWSGVCGNMERPARWLAVLATMTGAFMVAMLAHRRFGTKGALLALATLTASPAFWWHGTGIGSSAPLLLVAGLAAGLAAAVRPGLAAGAALIAASASPYALARLGAAPDTTGLTARAARLADLACGSDLLPAGLAWIAGAAVLAALAWLLVRGASRGRAAALALVAALAATAAAPALAGAAPLGLTLTALLPAIALLVARCAHGSRTTLAFTVLAIMTIVSLAGLGRKLAEHPAGPDARAALDWVVGHVDRHAWLVATGDDRALYRYYESTGHRTGLASFEVGSRQEAREVMRSALFYKAPVLVVVGRDPDVLATFAESYDALETPPDAPPGLRLFGFRAG